MMLPHDAYQRLQAAVKQEYMRWRQAGSPPPARGGIAPGHIPHDQAMRAVWARFYRARLQPISPPAEKGD
jgi:hypothetical protein